MGYKNNSHKTQLTWMLVILVAFLTIGGTLALKGVQHYQQPTLVGSWKNIDTGERVKFNQNGNVVIKGYDTIPHYQLIDGNYMEYEVEGKTFKMYYNLEGSQLQWGFTKETLQVFKKD